VATAARLLACALLGLAGACASAPPPAPAVEAPPATADWRAVRFGRGHARVALPPRYQVHVTDDGSLESQTAGPGATVRLFIDVHDLEEIAPGLGATRGACAAFLHQRAREKNLAATEQGDKVSLLEPGVADVVEGQPTKNVHVQICAGEALFVMTMTVREADADAPAVREFYDAELEPIIASLKWHP
jgi:hypothetical protein